MASIKRNNPGNIRSFRVGSGYSTPFKHELTPPDIKQGANSGFRIFDSLPSGYRALFIVLKQGYLNKGLNTIARIFPVYAPSGDNNSPSAYISQVESITGINRNTILRDYKDLIPIVEAITKVENGVNANREAVINGYKSINSSTLLDSFISPTLPVISTEQNPASSSTQKNKYRLPLLIGGGILVTYVGYRLYKHYAKK